jgi:enoyl-CoA hydratase
MNFADYKATTLRRDGRVLHATFNRPETMNAMDDDLQTDLELLLAEVAKDDATHVLVLTGAGRAFSAGGSIDEMQTCIEQPQLFREGTERGKRHLAAILDCPKPIIAKVNGHAIGLGATLALFCDIVVATKSAKIADPHVQVGLCAGDGGAVIWPALLGYARAKAYLLTGDAVTGEEAERIGLIHRAVEADALDAVVDELAQRIANGASQAVQYTKRSVNLGLKHLIDQVLEKSFEYEVITQRSQDHQEAVHAFRERRKPQFSGK